MTEPVDDGERHQRRVERSRKGGLALKAKYGRDPFRLDGTARGPSDLAGRIGEGPGSGV